MTTEPLDLEPIKKRKFSQWLAVDDRLALLAEVERLRAEIADRANVEADLRAQLAGSGQQIARVRQAIEGAGAGPLKHVCDGNDDPNCGACWEYAILRALDGSA